MTFAQKVDAKLYALSDQREKLTPEERAIMRLLITDRGKYISQRHIAQSEQWLGCHPVHETQNKNKEETTLRQVREIIRQLRIKYRLPIISSNKGYKIAETEQEAENYLKTQYGTISAQIKALKETHEAMRDSLTQNQTFNFTY